MKAIILTCLFALISVQGALSQDTLAVNIEDNRFLILDAVLNDSLDARFMLDTGAGLDVVSGRLFEKLEGRAEPAGMVTALTSTGSRVYLELYEIRSMEVGSLKRNNWRVAPFPELDGYESFDGILSLKFFEDHPFSIDFPSQRIVLETPASVAEIQKEAEAVPIYYHAYTDVTLDVFIPLVLNEEVRILAEFDTGTGIEYMIHPYFLNALGIDTSAVQGPDWEIDGETRRAYGPVMSSIRLDGSELIEGRDLKTTCLEGFTHEGLVGWELFRDNVITINWADRQMLVR